VTREHQLGGVASWLRRLFSPMRQFSQGSVLHGTTAPRQDTANLQIGTVAYLTVQWLDAHGNAAPIEGLIGWVSSNPSIARLTPDPLDHARCLVYAPGWVGDAVVQATVDAQVGEGVRVVAAYITITVTLGKQVCSEHAVFTLQRS